MKQYVLMALAVAALTACNSEDMHEADASKTVAMTFNVQGDFTLTTHDFTRALTADGKDMTDVWVWDYVGTDCQQTVHQTSGDADFGTPTMGLGLGTHHLYFVASRGVTPTVYNDAKTITWATVRDTFWKHYELTVTGGTSSGSRAVSLDRVVTKLKAVFLDAIPTGAAKFEVTPASWYYGIDYTTGEPSDETINGTITVNIPSSEIGVVNETVSIFGFSSTTDWTTDVVVDCKTSDSSVIGSATISAAPFVRNRVSEYTGPLFGDNGSMTLNLNTEWSTSHTGTW
jgi:hypothetical protein